MPRAGHLNGRIADLIGPILRLAPPECAAVVRCLDSDARSASIASVLAARGVICSVLDGAGVLVHPKEFTRLTSAKVFFGFDEVWIVAPPRAHEISKQPRLTGNVELLAHPERLSVALRGFQEMGAVFAAGDGIGLTNLAQDESGEEEILSALARIEPDLS